MKRGITRRLFCFLSLSLSENFTFYSQFSDSRSVAIFSVAWMIYVSTSRPSAPETSARLSLQAFRSWTSSAKPGDRCLYHHGFLAIDRIQGLSRSDQSERKRLATIADHALALAVEGRLDLCQERLGKADYAYWAVVRFQTSGRRA